MHYRDATHADIPALLDLGASFLAASPYASMLHLQGLDASLRGLLSAGPEHAFAHVACVYDGDEHVVGALLGALSEPWFGSVLTATELAWWVSPAYRGTAGMRLLRAFEDWAMHHDAQCIALSELTMPGSPDLGVALERHGYRAVEKVHVRVLTRAT